MNENENKKSWLQIVIEIEPKHEDMASWLMMQLGANGCQVLSAKAQDKVVVEASFPKNNAEETSTQRINTINAQLEEYGLAYCLKSMEVKSIEQQDWLSEWKKGYVPFTVKNTFLICPIWLQENLTADERNNHHVILIDPGMAFGTGYHATTQFCLKTLINYKDRKNVLDVGTGSGILSIAFAKLNDRANIVAVEIEEDAVRYAQKNIALNEAERGIALIAGSTDKLLHPSEKTKNDIPSRFELVLSNLTYEDIVSLLPDYQELLAPEGVIIGAGILKEKLPLLEKALSTYNMVIKEHEIDGIWAGVVVNRVPA